jgi:hypothetical protein
VSYHSYGTPDQLFLDRSPNIGPLISRWELDKFKNCLNKSFRTFKILTLLYQQSSNLLIPQRDLSGPRLGALSNNRGSEHSECILSDIRIIVLEKNICQRNKIILDRF